MKKNLEEILKDHEELVKEHGEKALIVLECKIELASAYAYQGNGSEAFRLIKEVYEAYLEQFGKEHNLTMSVYGMLGNLAAALGMHDMALSSFEEVSDYWISHYGEDDPRSMMSKKQYEDYKTYYLK